MKVRFFFNSIVARVIKAEAITLYPFIFFADDERIELALDTVAHEMVHVEQVRNMGWLKFYWSYLVQYVKGRLAGKAHWDAYASITFEKEAYAKQRTDKKYYEALYWSEKNR